MKKLGVVLQYELMTYIKNKSYVISTVVIAVIAAAIMFVPRFIDISAINIIFIAVRITRILFCTISNSCDGTYIFKSWHKHNSRQ